MTRIPAHGGHRLRLIAGVVAAVLAVLAVAAGTRALRQPSAAPEPVRTSAAAPTAPADDRPARARPGLPPADPVGLRIPAIDVDGPLLRLGRHDDGTVAVPSFAQAGRAGWYENSAPPGSAGTAVILGHVDSPDGPAVFARLDELEPGDEIRVARADATTAVFTVEKVDSYPKSDFPTRKVYGAQPGPVLRLITCGGAFDRRTGSYLANIVVYAVPA